VTSWLHDSTTPRLYRYLLSELRGALFATTKERLLGRALEVSGAGEKVVVDLYKQRAAVSRSHHHNEGFVAGTMFNQLLQVREFVKHGIPPVYVLMLAQVVERRYVFISQYAQQLNKIRKQ
jgi:hypothetical protein